MACSNIPQYTRPEEFRGMKVPEVLLSGDHQRVKEWRREKSLEITRQRRPDLLDAANLAGAATGGKKRRASASLCRPAASSGV